MQGYQQLEKEFADFAERRYAVAVNTGTAALHLSLVALGIGPGDEVIVPNFTFAACAFAVSYTGATPVFVDCDKTLNIDVGLIEAKITSRTKAIMPVHVYGRRCNMEAIEKIAMKHGLKIIEDASEAHGVMLGGSHVACYSFQASKIINCEEGGIIVTDDYLLYNRLQYLKNLAHNPERDYAHNNIGFNYRMPNATAELALHSLRNVKNNLAKREIVDSWMNEHISKQEPHDVSWVYDMYHPRAKELIKWLNDNKVKARHFFKPMDSLPMYAPLLPIGSIALAVSQFGVVIPINPDTTLEEVKYIARTIHRFDVQDILDSGTISGTC